MAPRRWVRALVVVTLAGAVLWVGALPGGAAVVSQTFSYNGTDGTDGTPQTFVVPAGVCQVTVDALGAQAAAGNDNPGGKGGEAIATIPVTSGETLQVTVGGQPVNVAGGGFNGGAKTFALDHSNSLF